MKKGKAIETCLGCGGPLTEANVDGGRNGNPYFHKVCMNDGVGVALPRGKYTAEQLSGTWAEGVAFRQEVTK